MNFQPNYINPSRARIALDDMDDFARMANIDPHGPRTVLEQFIDQVERSELVCRRAPAVEVKLENVTENPAAQISQH